MPAASPILFCLTPPPPPPLLRHLKPTPPPYTIPTHTSGSQEGTLSWTRLSGDGAPMCHFTCPASFPVRRMAAGGAFPSWRTTYHGIQPMGGGGEGEAENKENSGAAG